MVLPTSGQYFLVRQYVWLLTFFDYRVGYAVDVWLMLLELIGQLTIAGVHVMQVKQGCPAVIIVGVTEKFGR